MVHNGQPGHVGIGKRNGDWTSDSGVASQDRERPLGFIEPRLRPGIQGLPFVGADLYLALAANPGAVARRFDIKASLAGCRQQRGAIRHLHPDRARQKTDLHRIRHDGNPFTAFVIAVMLSKVVDVERPQAGEMISTPSRTNSTARSATLTGPPHSNK